MGRYILKRLGLSLITLVIVSFTVFAAAEVLPGDVGRTILGPYASQQQVDQLNHKLGADQPLVRRYLTWAGDFIKGDWGTSPIQNVRGAAAGARPAQELADPGGFALAPDRAHLRAVRGAARRSTTGGRLDRIITITGLSFVALPEFVVGVFVIVVFAVQLGWFPVSSPGARCQPGRHLPPAACCRRSR